MISTYAISTLGLFGLDYLSLSTDLSFVRLLGERMKTAYNTFHMLFSA